MYRGLYCCRSVVVLLVRTVSYDFSMFNVRFSVCMLVPNNVLPNLFQKIFIVVSVFIYKQPYPCYFCID